MCPARSQSALCLLALLIGCGRGASVAVDPLCGATSAAFEPGTLPLLRAIGAPALLDAEHASVLAIAGEERRAVPGLGLVTLIDDVELAISASGRHVETLEMDLRLALAPHLVLEPRVFRDAWRRLPAALGHSRREGGRKLIDVEYDLRHDAALADTARIGLTAYLVRERTSSRYETPSFEVQEGAVLAASLGILEPAWEQGRVAFRLLACEAEDCECVHAEVVDPLQPGARRWQERRISLAALTGRRVSLQLESELLDPGPDAFGLALWAAPELMSVDPRPAASARNLLLISLDTLRADHLGSYGYSRDTSPAIDSLLAGRGTLFEHAVAPATTTAPSHMTLLTSLQPSVHGVVSNVAGRALPARAATLAELLQAAGWVTGAVTENGAIMRGLGFDRGFSFYHENLSAQLIRPEGHIEATFDAGMRFVRQHRGTRWLLFLHTYQVHHPYAPPPAYAELFAGDELALSRDGPLVSGGLGAHSPLLYDQEIRYTDDRVRRLVSELEAEGLLQGTLVVLIGDHGEAFFEHEYLGHGADLHQETVHVPLIVRGPGVAEARRVSEPVGLVDLMPTLLELLGVEPPAGLMGRSIAPLLRDAALSAEARAGWLARPLFSEAWQTTGVTRSGGVEIDQPTLAVRTGDRKLIRYREGDGFRYGYYDLATDPGEHEDLQASFAGEVAALRLLLDTYAAETARQGGALGALGDLEFEPAAVEIEAERLEKLRALGYIE